MQVLGILWQVVLPCCLAASGGGSRSEVSESVDLIELNHYYDGQGRHSYDQVIFYEWSHDYSRFHVIAWFLVDEDSCRLPMPEPNGKTVAVRWFDREIKAQRVVRSEVFRETWSVGKDPERVNKLYLHEKHRLSLLRPRTLGPR